MDDPANYTIEYTPGVRAYLLSRLGQTVLVVFLSLTAVFFLVRLGGDPVLLFLPMDIQAKDLNEFRERLGFNDPLAVQYGHFVSRALHGDFGESLRYKRDALDLVLERLPATLSLAVTALLLTFCVAVPVGVLSAVRRGSLLDLLGMGGAVLGQAVPGFWLGLMMIYFFSVRLGWLPTGGMGGPLHFVMPCIVLASFYAARMARLTRSSVLDTLNEEFVLTARAKGLAERAVIGKHTLKNSAIPIVTLAGLDTGQLLGGAVITETIFAWPGLGRLTVQALLNRDFPVVLAAVFVFSVTYTLINLAVDLVYGWLDPRTRASAGA
jgi:peptide/nickel transport system permease protein